MKMKKIQLGKMDVSSMSNKQMNQIVGGCGSGGTSFPVQTISSGYSTKSRSGADTDVNRDADDDRIAIFEMSDF
jgi:natural product precursor